MPATLEAFDLADLSGVPALADLTALAGPATGGVLLDTPGLRARLLTWAPGSGTRAHDHDGAHTALAVLCGELVEDHFPDPVWSTSPVRRRLRPGDLAVFAPDRVHVLANPGPHPVRAVQLTTAPGTPPRHRSVGAASFLAELLPSGPR